MKTMRLLEAWGAIEDHYVREAWIFRKRRTVWKRVLPAAAALLLLLGGLLMLYRPRIEPAELPMLRIDSTVGGMGFEGYSAHSIEELVTGNPWEAGMALATLPVYRNAYYADRNGQLEDADLEAMEAWALEIAARMGLSDFELTVQDNRPTEEERQLAAEQFAAVGKEIPDFFFQPSRVVLEAEGIQIRVDARLETVIRFDPDIALPGEYNFYHRASHEDTYAVGQYLVQEYAALLGMKNPILELEGGDYNIHNQQSYSIRVYEGKGNDKDRFVQYHLAAATFACNDDGKLSSIILLPGSPGRLLGEYPIVSPETAEELLLQGHYMTSAPEEFPGMEYVHKVELVYRNSWGDALFMPYYRFYVELPGMPNETGKTIFATYYVPAVESRYIEEMPVWDGSFN